MTSSPHDALFRHTFSQPEHAAALFKARLPPAIVAAIDWSTLTLVPGSFVDKHLRWRHTDLLFRVSLAGGGEAFLYALIEHQSSPDHWMPLRLIDYVVRFWNDLLKNHPNLKRLPPVFPIVVYHGAHPWNAPQHIHELIEADQTLMSALAPYLPSMQMDLLDLSSQTDAELRARALTHLGTLTVMCLQRLPRSHDPLGEIARLMDLFEAVSTSSRGLDALVAILNYLYDVATPEPDTVRTLLLPLGDIAEVAMMTYAEKLREEGRIEGEAKGRTEGESRGRAEGESYGRASTLLKQLRLKFGEVPEDVVARVQSASIEDLDRWAERILNADSIEDTLR